MAVLTLENADRSITQSATVLKMNGEPTNTDTATFGHDFDQGSGMKPAHHQQSPPLISEKTTAFASPWA